MRMIGFSLSVKDGVRIGLGCALASGMTVLMLSAEATASEPKQIDETVEQALQLTPDLNNGRELYHGCAICHTPEGWGSPNGHYPQIAGQHRSVVMKQLADIYKGNRDNPTMIPFTRSLFADGPQRLADIAAYVEQLKMVPNNSVGPGIRLAEGKKLYEDNCQKCHGENGEGSEKDFYPRIQGQHYEYIQRQMQWIKNSRRRNADEKMTDQLMGFSYGDIASVADYVSRMQPDPARVADHQDWRNPDFRSGFRSVPRHHPEMPY